MYTYEAHFVKTLIRFTLVLLLDVNPLDKCATSPLLEEHSCHMLHHAHACMHGNDKGSHIVIQFGNSHILYPISPEWQCRLTCCQRTVLSRLGLEPRTF